MKAVRTGYGAVMAWISVSWMAMGALIAFVASPVKLVAGLGMGAGICAMSVLLGLPFMGFRIDPNHRRIRIRQPNAFVDLTFDDVAVVEFPYSIGIYVPGLAVVDRSGRRIRVQLVRQGARLPSERLSELRELFEDAGVECGERKRSW